MFGGNVKGGGVMKVEGHGRAGEIFLFFQEQAYRAAGIQLKVGIGNAAGSAAQV